MNSIILTKIVMLMCTSPFPNERNACSSALESTFRQTGIYENVKRWEKNTGKDIEYTIDRNVNASIKSLAVKIFVVNKVVSGEQAILQLGRGYLGESYYWDIGIKNNRIGVNWEF